ncbi:MAG: DNA recombination protein RmuC [Planctomycetota bacterium]|nr:MAG: DNA recombination protein RmuC [Planctomycetota bacterium]
MEIIILILSILNFVCILVVAILYFKLKSSSSNDVLQQSLEKKIESTGGLIKGKIVLEVSEKLHAIDKETIKGQGQFKEEILSRLSNFQLELLKAQDNFRTDLLKKNGDLNEQFVKKISEEFKELKENSTKNFDKLISLTESKLNHISGKVDEKLEKGFEKTMSTFQSVLERLTKIDEAQKKIETLSSEIVDLQSVLTDKKSRGVFGEVLLSQVISSIFGDKNDRLYQLQYSLINNGDKVIADAVIHMPGPLNMVAIDSKFPLENYRKMVDKKLELPVRELAEKGFKINIKKHVNDIANKYIIEGVTGEMAIMFLPSESIFAEIMAYHMDLVDYAHERKIWITSPSTLLAFLFTLQSVVRDLETSKQAGIIQKELTALSKEFQLFTSRWGNFTKHLKNINSDVEKLDITSGKITKKFEKIENVEIDTEVTEPEIVFKNENKEIGSRE